MKAIHLAAKHGYTDILEVLKGFVSWKCTSRKVVMLARIMLSV